MEWRKQMQVKSGVPIPPALKQRGKWNWLNTLKCGQSIHFDDERQFENVRRTLRTKGFNAVTRKTKEAWIIWITEEPKLKKTA